MFVSTFYGLLVYFMGWGEPGLRFLLFFLPILGELAGEAISTPRNAGHFGSLCQDVGRDLVAQGSHATCRRTQKPKKTEGTRKLNVFFSDIAVT